jgi:hypothetical protein
MSPDIHFKTIQEMNLFYIYIFIFLTELVYIFSIYIIFL